MAEEERRATGADAKRTVLSGEEARQGKIVLGRHAMWIVPGCFVAIVVLLLIWSAV